MRLPQRCVTERGCLRSPDNLGGSDGCLRRRPAEGINRLIVLPGADNRAPACGDMAQYGQVTCVEVLVLVDDQEIVIDAFEIAVVLQRMKERIRQLGEQGVSVHLPVLTPRAVESRAMLWVNARILLGAQ